MINKEEIKKRAYSYYSRYLKLEGKRMDGKGEMLTHCPFPGHGKGNGDQNPSFSVNVKDGRWNCHACKIGGDMFDLHAQVTGRDIKREFRVIANEVAEIVGLGGDTNGQAQAIPAPPVKTPQSHSPVAANEKRPNKLVEIYDYTDEAGRPLYRKERWELWEDGKRVMDGAKNKTFRLKHCRDGQWHEGKGDYDTQPVLFQYPAIREAQQVFIVESERIAQKLIEAGVTATALFTKKWQPVFSEVLADKEIVVIQDNDPTGREFIRMTTEEMRGYAKSIKVLSDDSLPSSDNIIDRLLMEGDGKIDTGKLMAIVKRWELWEEPTEERESVVLVRLDTVTPKPVKWLWEGYIPLGNLTLLDGDPGLGKSTIIEADIAARVTRGSSMPDGSKGTRGGVILMTLEDSLENTIVPRLKAVNADLKEVSCLKNVFYGDGVERIPTIGDIEEIREACIKTQAKLLVISPLMGYLGGGVKSKDDQDIRQALAPLVRLLEDMEIAGVAIRHLNKSGGSQAIYRGGGSIGISGAARSVLLVAKDPDDESKRVLSVIKSNLAPMAPSLSYRIEKDYVEEGLIETSRISWEGVSKHTADTLLAVPSSPEEKSASDEAKEFLEEILADGPIEVGEVKKQAKERGINEKPLRTARERLGVKADKGTSFRGKYRWYLPEVALPSPRGCPQTSKGQAREEQDGKSFSEADSVEVALSGGKGKLGENGGQAGTPPPPQDEPDHVEVDLP